MTGDCDRHRYSAPTNAVTSCLIALDCKLLPKRIMHQLKGLYHDDVSSHHLYMNVRCAQSIYNCYKREMLYLSIHIGPSRISDASTNNTRIVLYTTKLSLTYVNRRFFPFAAISAFAFGLRGVLLVPFGAAFGGGFATRGAMYRFDKAFCTMAGS